MAYFKKFVLLPLGYIAALPLALVGILVLSCFFLLCFVFLVPRLVLENRHWKNKLKAQGRYKNIDFSPAQLNNGTLIVDSPTLGWKVTHCWWTPENVEERYPFPIPNRKAQTTLVDPDQEPSKTSTLHFEKWLDETYLSVETGSAILLCTRRSKRFAERLQLNTPGFSVVHSWSGLLNMPEDEDPDPSLHTTIEG